MSRQARVVAEGVPHHVTQRGNNRQDILLTDDDRRFYIDLLRDRSAQFGVAILGYCLMTNHVHLVAVPRHRDSLAKALGQTHWRYAMQFNRRYHRSGHLWEFRDRLAINTCNDSEPIDDSKLSIGPQFSDDRLLNHQIAGQPVL